MDYHLFFNFVKRFRIPPALENRPLIEQFNAKTPAASGLTFNVIVHPTRIIFVQIEEAGQKDYFWTDTL